MTNPTIEEILTAFKGIEEFEKEATPGPWSSYAENGITAIGGSEIVPIVGWTGFDDSRRSLPKHRANAELIVALRNLTPHISEAVKVMARQREALKRIDDFWTAEFPDGPGNAHPFPDTQVRLSDDTLSIWREIRTAISGSHDHAE